MSAVASHARLVRKLREALGDAISAALDDDHVVEVMLNPDGRLFVERLGEGITPIGALKPGAAEIIIGSVAHALQTEADEDRPIISGELPIGGHRFEGLLPPVVSAPSFTIRRRASRLIPLDDYVASGVMTRLQAATIRSAIRERMNIVVSGGTGSGKTTLANAVIAELVQVAPEHRLLILEDTAEIQCAAENAVALHTTDTVDMAPLLKSTMRFRPDRIIVGEVRGGEAMALLTSWNTGHDGGAGTLHANSGRLALSRLQSLIAEAPEASNYTPEMVSGLIGEAVNVVIFISKDKEAKGGRAVKEIIAIDGFDAASGEYRVRTI